MDRQWQVFGDKAQFAFEYRFLQDPDRGEGATPLESASWGEFRLWVRSKNLCLHRHHGEFLDCVTWYLLPLFTWLADSWEPLLHEEQFPSLPADKEGLDARRGYMDSLRRYLGDGDPKVTAKGDAWYAWWGRHGLRSCRHGGLFPDLFIRRLLDFAEVSWGNLPVAGAGEDLSFVEPVSVARLPVEQVAEPLLQALQVAVQWLQQGDGNSQELATLSARVREITAPNRLRACLSWYAGRMVDFLDRIPSRVKSGLEQDLGFIRRLAPSGAMMFGALSPEIGHDDVEKLFQAFVMAHQDGRESEPLRALVVEDPNFPGRSPHDEGYDAALDLLDAVSVGMGKEWVDVRAICRHLSIRVAQVDLADSNIRGAAFAGEGVTPTILINGAHKNNRYEVGRRFTLGHELCHILNDRFFGSDVAVVTTPWAPEAIEQRANAFAAMVLMPLDLLNARIARMTEPLESTSGIAQLADTLRVSRRAVRWHLFNLNKLDARPETQ